MKILLKHKSKQILRKLRAPSGLFVAGGNPEKTHYAHQAWIRDSIYQAIGLEQFDTPGAVKTYQALLDVLLKHEYKIDWAIREKPDAKHKYIHARYHPITFDEFDQDWGNKQNDAVGALLFKIGELHEKRVSVLRDSNDYRIVQKLVYYLESIQYWKDCDNGVWEENEEVHASSVGACVAGLIKIQKLVYVPDELYLKGLETLNALLPRESASKEVDLALLSLIYPYKIVTPEQCDAILQNIEQKLVREKGVLRYLGDCYFNYEGKEASWTMGFPWLAKIYKDLGNKEKYNHYLAKTHEVMTTDGELPELYLGDGEKFNENTPLGWAQAMYLVAVS